MQVELNIKNDSELRSYIKDMIRGQVISILRDEFELIVKDAFKRKEFELLKDDTLNKIIKAEIYELLCSSLNITSGYNRHNKLVEEFRNMVREEIANSFKKMYLGIQ